MSKAATKNFDIQFRSGGNARKVYILITNEDSDPSRTPANAFSQNPAWTDGYCKVPLAGETLISASTWEAAYQPEINAVFDSIVEQNALVYLFVAGSKSLVSDVTHAQQCNTFYQYCNPDLQVQTLNNLIFEPHATLQNLIANDQVSSVQGMMLNTLQYARCYDVADTLVAEFTNSFFALVVRDVSHCKTSAFCFFFFFFFLSPLLP